MPVLSQSVGCLREGRRGLHCSQAVELHPVLFNSRVDCAIKCLSIVLLHLQGVLAVPPWNQGATGPCNTSNYATLQNSTIHCIVYWINGNSILRYCTDFCTALLSPHCTTMVSQSLHSTPGLVHPWLFQLPLMLIVLKQPQHLPSGRISNRQIVLSHFGRHLGVWLFKNTTVGTETGKFQRL